MSRLIDADELLKCKTDHEYISTHIIYNAPTVDAISTQTVRDAIAEIKTYKTKYNNKEYGQSYAIKAVNDVLEIISRHTGVKE